jgi:hypothetical protein
MIASCAQSYSVGPDARARTSAVAVGSGSRKRRLGTQLARLHAVSNPVPAEMYLSGDLAALGRK